MAGLEGSREGCGLGLSSSRNCVRVIGELKKAFGIGGGSESIVKTIVVRRMSVVAMI